MSAVDLSSINRAALAAKEGYWWINAIGLALSVLIAKMSFTAYAAAPDKAWLCVTCQALAIAMAMIARRALTGQMLIPALVAGAGAGGCAWWASHGLAAAWAHGGDAANAWMVFFLTALEPGIFLLAEHVKEGREALRAAQAQADRETAEALAAARARDETNRQKPPANRQTDRAAGDKSPVARLRLVETAHLPADRPDQPVDAAEPPAIARQAGDQPVEEIPALEQPPHSETTFASADAHARHLIAHEGVRHRNELARRVRGLSTYRAAQLLDELSPGWRNRTNAA